MKLKDTYNMYKQKYQKYVIIIKCGNFYEVYGEEAYILNNLFGYKIKNVSGLTRVGFPIISYNKVTDKLKKFNINYVVVNDGTIRKKFNKNNYDKYISNLDIDKRINNIKDKLVLLKEKPSIIKVLEKVENLI